MMVGVSWQGPRRGHRRRREVQSRLELKRQAARPWLFQYLVKALDTYWYSGPRQLDTFNVLQGHIHVEWNADVGDYRYNHELRGQS